MKNNVTTHIWSKLKWSAITGVFFYVSDRFNKQKYQYLIKKSLISKINPSCLSLTPNLHNFKANKGTLPFEST